MFLEVKDKKGFTHVFPSCAVEILVSVNAVVFRRRGFSDVQCIFETAEKANTAVQEMIAAAEAGAKIFRFIPE